MITIDKANALEQEAEKNDGHCSHCTQTIKIYRYKINKQMVDVLRGMLQVVKDTNINQVNFNDLDIPYRLSSQRTKMRLHGLITQVVDKPNTWLITKKGGDFLRGKPIQSKVVVFANQLLGHEGEMITVARVTGEMEVEQKPVNETEARAYSSLRKPKRNLTYQAEYIGRTYSKEGYQNGKRYELNIQRMQVGRPVVLTGPISRTYVSVAMFNKDWKIIKEES